jgi:hypothetical protein
MHDFERQLRARLRTPDPEVPAAVDAAIRAAGARAAHGFRRRRRRLVLLRGGGLAAAAAAVLLFWSGFGGDGEPRRFDVVDAWRVARGLDASARYDQNRDGRVDGSDAELMLQAIVALPARRGS